MTRKHWTFTTIACTAAIACAAIALADAPTTDVDPVVAGPATVQDSATPSPELAAPMPELVAPEAVAPVQVAQDAPGSGEVPVVTGPLASPPSDHVRWAMSPEERWDVMMTHCPDDYGAFAELWTWSPAQGEQDLLAYDIEGAGTTFDLLADYEGTSIIIRVRDANGDSVAVIKTTSSNTLVEGEIYAYRLARYLDFEDVVVPTAPVELGAGALQKMYDLLDGITYDDERKERQRRNVLSDLEDAIEGGATFHGAMKPWIGAFVFNGEIGHRDSLGEMDVMDTLDANGRQPGLTEDRLSQYTRLYQPFGTHRGFIEEWQLAEDLSNVMLMDALTGQNDRFAGANFHVWAVDRVEVEDGERRDLPIFQMGDVRLLALDNGATLHSSTGSGIRDLMGTRESGTRVERFQEETLNRLYGFARRAIGWGCDTEPFADERDAIWEYFGVSGDEIELAEGYLELTMEYLDELRADHGDSMYLVPDMTPLPVEE